MMYTNDIKGKKRWTGPGLDSFDRSLKSDNFAPVTIWFRRDGGREKLSGKVVNLEPRSPIGDMYTVTVRLNGGGSIITFEALLSPRRSYSHGLDRFLDKV